MSEKTKEEHLAHLAKVAQPANLDLEVELLKLHERVLARREDPEKKRAYEEARDKLLKLLQDEGPRYFIDSEGHKRYAYPVKPEQVEVDMDELLVAYAKGEISSATYDRVAPRRIDRDALRRAVSVGDIAPAVFARIATLVPKTGHVGFSDPIE